MIDTKRMTMEDFKRAEFRSEAKAEKEKMKNLLYEFDKSSGEVIEVEYNHNRRGVHAIVQMCRNVVKENELNLKVRRRGDRVFILK